MSATLHTQPAGAAGATRNNITEATPQKPKEGFWTHRNVGIILAGTAAVVALAVVAVACCIFIPGGPLWLGAALIAGKVVLSSTALASAVLLPIAFVGAAGTSAAVSVSIALEDMKNQRYKSLSDQLEERLELSDNLLKDKDLWVKKSIEPLINDMLSEAKKHHGFDDDSPFEIISLRVKKKEKENKDGKTENEYSIKGDLKIYSKNDENYIGIHNGFKFYSTNQISEYISSYSGLGTENYQSFSLSFRPNFNPYKET